MATEQIELGISGDQTEMTGMDADAVGYIVGFTLIAQL
jgi:hypothetical protein